MTETVFQGAILIGIAASFNSARAIQAQYLETVGKFSWMQMYLVAEFDNLFFIVIFWIVYSLKTKQSLFSYFPKFTKSNLNLWFILIIRGICAASLYLFFVLALLHCNSGDAILIRAIITSVGNILIGVIYFKEQLTKWIIFSLILCIFSLILICQPSFIFNNLSIIDIKSNTNVKTMSFVGFLFILISGIFRVVNKSLIKLSKTKYDTHWLGVLIIGFVICFFESLIVFGLSLYIYDNNISHVWHSWYSDGANYSNHTYIMINVVFGLFGFVELIYNILHVKGYQMGNIGRLGIIANIDIIVTYILQVLLLNENDNYIAYIGICIVLIAVTVLFFEQYNQSKSNDLQYKLKQETKLEQHDELLFDPTVNASTTPKQMEVHKS